MGSRNRNIKLYRHESKSKHYLIPGVCVWVTGEKIRTWNRLTLGPNDKSMKVNDSQLVNMMGGFVSS